jgi:hypothetical protein
MNMWKDLDMQRMAEEENRYSSPRSPDEVEQLVIFARLELCNLALPCGSQALHRRLNEFYHLTPLPSVRTIGRILVRNGLLERR